MKMIKNSRCRDKIAWIILAVILLVFCGTITWAQNSKNDVYFNTLRNVFDFILNNYVDEVDPLVLYEGAMNGMLDSLGDPYSKYMDEAMVTELNDTTTGVFYGVGLYIQKINPASRKPTDSPYVEVVSPIEDTPGARAGILPGDLISEIDGESTESMEMETVLKKLRGEAGTSVTITIIRGESIVFKTTIIREAIEVPTIKREILPGEIAYLRIIEFTPQTPARIFDALKWFESMKYSSLIIDIRNNPGGLLTSVIRVADFFLDNGVIVSTRPRVVSESAIYYARSEILVPKNIPIVLLINRGSASASEILAGALKDQKRAYLIGEKTFGKGAVQQIMPIGSGDTAFKLTMSRYFTPSNANIDKKGIYPDLEIVEPPLSLEAEKALTNLYENKLIENWVKEHSDADKKEQEAFINGLISGGIGLDNRILGKLLRNEYDKWKGIPVFDLEYDIQLIEAIKIVTSKELPALISQAKTVTETQNSSTGE